MQTIEELNASAPAEACPEPPMQHFHAAYAPIASEVVYVAAPGALVPDWSLLPYTKADKTQWPFVADPHSP